MDGKIAQRIDAHAQYLREMMRRLGMDPDEVAARDREGFRDSVEKCESCSARVDCEFWLRADAPPTELPSFCVNSDFLSICRQRGN